MNHLTADEIAKFVTMRGASEENNQLLDRVNNHIRKCEKCFNAVKELQDILDSLDMISDVGEVAVPESEFFEEPQEQKKREQLR
ncbi:MAG: hypothetical protein E7591_05485 [Ruminococcaceae bacterium]|nr:hypothetical protein [Oscillospiraceae bacterium]